MAVVGDAKIRVGREGLRMLELDIVVRTLELVLGGKEWWASISLLVLLCNTFAYQRVLSD